jgi:hypothetical protein
MTQVVQLTEPARQLDRGNLTIFIEDIRCGSDIMAVPRQCVRPFLRKPMYRSSNNNSSNESVPVSSSGVVDDKSSPASNTTSSNPQEEAATAAAQPHHQQDGTIRRMERHLTLTDLIAIGIGATIGSG